MDRAWLFLPGTWYDRNCTSYSANCSVLYGNTVLLCKEFKEIARLVHKKRKGKQIYYQLSDDSIKSLLKKGEEYISFQ